MVLVHAPVRQRRSQTAPVISSKQKRPEVSGLFCICKSLLWVMTNSVPGGPQPRTSWRRIRSAQSLREKVTEAAENSGYKVYRCSELGRFDCSPNPEDLHGLVPRSGLAIYRIVPQMGQFSVKGGWSRRSAPHAATEWWCGAPGPSDRRAP